MGNCIDNGINCHYCKTSPNDEIYIVTITCKGKFNGKNICSICYEQKVLEKHNLGINENILPIIEYN